MQRAAKDTYKKNKVGWIFQASIVVEQIDRCCKFFPMNIFLLVVEIQEDSLQHIILDAVTMFSDSHIVYVNHKVIGVFG